MGGCLSNNRRIQCASQREQTKKLANNNGKMSSNDKDNAKILKTYFQDVFNRKATIDPSVLDELTQRPVTMSFDMAPSIDEIKTAMKKIKKNKAPGISGTTPNMIKNLPEEGFQILTSHIKQFWEDPDYDHKAWHKMKLILLYKGKGKLQDPNNWRGIYFKEMSAKILSLILAKRLLLNLGKMKAGVNQFGHVSCQEALHTLHSTLILKCQCGLKT